MSTPKFLQGKGTFHTELKNRVNLYFSEMKKPTTGNALLFLKALFFCTCYILLYVHLVFFTPAWWVAFPECIFMAIIISGIGFNVMHDGSHGSFSKSKVLNKMAKASVNFLGASAIMWHTKHNIIHHTYTNIEGVDDDIEAGFLLRFTSGKKRLWIHKFQHYYFWFLYTLLHLLWIFFSDYKKYFTQKVGNVPIRKFTLKEHFSFWIAKVLYLFMAILLPIYLLGFMNWMVGFLIISMVTGFLLSIVFQLAHTVEHTEFPLPAEPSGKIENEWAIHQVATTANFATNNKLISWLVGGLNFQIEHHLFPKISHIHYPAISKIIKQTCNEYGIKYNEYKRMGQAIVSHFMYMKRLGRA